MSKLTSDRTAGRLTALLNGRGLDGSSGKGGGGGQRWVLVRCDSATAAGASGVLSQCYPATVLRPNADASAPPEEEEGLALLTLLGASGGAAVPTSGRVYSGLMTAEVEEDRQGSIAGRQRVFAAETASTASVSSWKTPPVRTVTTAALPANTYANGTAGVGATITGNANGALPAQDFITLLAGDSFLVNNEASSAKNGIYTVTQVGSVSTPFILTRRTDADTAAKLAGACVTVTDASTHYGSQWQLRTQFPITVGTTGLVWSQRVYGPTVSADNEVPRFDLTTGKFLQQSGVFISDTKDVSATQGTSQFLLRPGYFIVNDNSPKVNAVYLIPTGSYQSAGILFQDDLSGLSVPNQIHNGGTTSTTVREACDLYATLVNRSDINTERYGHFIIRTANGEASKAAYGVGRGVPGAWTYHVGIDATCTVQVGGVNKTMTIKGGIITDIS